MAINNFVNAALSSINNLRQNLTSDRRLMNISSGIQSGYTVNAASDATKIVKKVSDDILHRMGGSHITHDQEPWQNFDRFYSINPDLDEISTGKQYIFIVRPELNIVDETQTNTLSSNTKNDPFFRYMMQYHRIILKSLTMNEFTAAHEFIPYLVGRTEMLQVPDYSIKSYNLIQPYTHYSLPYGGSGIESHTGGTFDITFRDDGQFRLHKLFQTWLYYIDGVSRGVFTPKDKFITYNKIDYATSVYQFIMAPNGLDILWWAKYTGCVPTSISNSDLSWNKGGTFDGKFSVPFQYFMFECLNPQIITDFNHNSTAAITQSSMYDADTLGMGLSYVGAPYVHAPNGWQMQLKWRLPTSDYV